MAGNQKKKRRSLTGQAWQRLKKNKTSMFGLGFIGVATLIAVLGALIRPDSTVDANDQSLSIQRKRPGFTSDFLQVRKNKKVDDVYFWEMMFFGGKPKAHKSVPITDYYFQGTKIVVETYSGVRSEEGVEGKKVPYNIADVLYPLDVSRPYKEVQDGDLTFYTLEEGRMTSSLKELREKVEKENIITKTFWLGTDKFGRDYLSRLMAGTIVSLSVGLIAVFISVLIGVVLGALAGYFKGWVDDIIMWLINVVWSVPALLLVIAVTFALGKGFTTIFFAVGMVMWVEVARIVRGQVLSVREKEFVEAGKALGYNSFRIISRHIIPNVTGPVIVMSAANFASAILIESGLSFLGVGVQIPTASWGSMIKQYYGYFTVDGMEYLAIFPGICIMLLVLAFMLVGNGLRDAFDAKAIDEEMNSGA